MSNKPDFKELYKNHNKLYPSPFDKRDYKFNQLVPVGAITIPDNFESPTTPFVYSQGETNMCCSCSYNLIRFMQEQDQSQIDDKFSVAFNYANRPAGEDFEGMYIRSCVSKGKEGSVPWDDFPGYYTYARCRKILNDKKSTLMKKAKPFAISSYYQCSNRESVQAAIISTKAVLGGIYVFNSFYHPDENNCIPYDPKTDLKNYGGHAIVICGWKTDSNGKLWWRVQNSWGEEYGDKGRVWVPESYPWLESPWAIVDEVFELSWEDYKKKYSASNKKPGFFDKFFFKK